MARRHVLQESVGAPGYADALAAILSAAQPGDVIAVPDPATEKKVREAAVVFGLEVDDEEVGIGIEVVAGELEPAPFDESMLEYMVQARDQAKFMAEVEDMISQASFDDQTIFVVADRREIGWLFAAVAKIPERVGKVRGTILGSNTIVTSLDDLPPELVPKLAVKIDAGNLSAAMVTALTDAGFAVGFKTYEGKLDRRGELIYLLIRDKGSLVVTNTILIGRLGEDVRIALPVPKEDMPKMELTGATPTEPRPEHPEEQKGEPGPASVEPDAADPARTDGKNMVDG